MLKKDVFTFLVVVGHRFGFSPKNLSVVGREVFV